MGDQIVALEIEVKRLNQVRDVLMRESEELKNRLADVT